MSVPFYWKLSCHTCHAAKKGLEEKKIPIQPINIIENPPSKKIFSALIAKYGAKEMIRRNSKDYKRLEVGKKMKNMSNAQLAALFSTHPDLASRPIVLVGEDVFLTRDPNFLEGLSNRAH